MNVLEAILYPTVDEHNQAGGAPLSRSPDQPLYGEGAPLDSVALVSLLVAVEQRIEDELGVLITLADEKAMSRSRSPFRTIATLAEYVTECLRAKGP